MGEKIIEFYTKAAQIGSLKAKMRLAMLTLIPSSKAMETPDTAENIKKFTDAFNELEKEFKAV